MSDVTVTGDIAIWQDDDTGTGSAADSGQAEAFALMSWVMSQWLLRHPQLLSYNVKMAPLGRLGPLVFITTPLRSDAVNACVELGLTPKYFFSPYLIADTGHEFSLFLMWDKDED